MNSSSRTARSATPSPSSTRSNTATPDQPLLTLEALGFGEGDLDQTVSSRYFMGGKSMRLREMIAILQRIYTGKIGAEFMHIASTKVRNWVRDRMEARPELPAPEPAAQRGILGHLLAAEAFERFLHTRYVGQKRFSLEGGETLMPLLETILAPLPGAGHPGNRHGHGAPRPAQRAGQFPEEVPRDDLHRVLRELHARPRPTATAT